MTLKLFVDENDATDTEFNAAINQIPSTFLHVMTSTDLDFTGLAGATDRASATLVASFPLHPACGNYLAIMLQSYAPSGTGEFWFEIVQGVRTDTLWNLSGIVNTTKNDPGESTIVNLETLTNGGDVTGQDCTVNLYLNEDVRVTSIRIWSGDSSSLGDYGG